MKVEIPKELKAAMPQTLWGRILSATPVVMAVVSTMLAGLASSEMTRAQYERSLGAQQQSKAGDQWSFFQAKRLRGALQRNSVDLLQATTELHPLDLSSFKNVAGLDLAAVEQFAKGEVPAMEGGPVLDPKIKAAIAAIEELQTDDDVGALLAKVDDKSINDAVRSARDRTQKFDVLTKPVNQVIDVLEKHFAGESSSLKRDFIAARLRYTAARYETEARLNQGIANLFELQVRKSNMAATRHHARSKRFFFGMLAAQAGVIISTFAMAASNRNLLWSLAAGAGIIAVGFAIYVYLCV